MNVYVWHDGSRAWEARLAQDGMRGGGEKPGDGEAGILVCWRKDAKAAGFPRLSAGGIRLNDPSRAPDLRDPDRLRRRLALYGVRYEPPEPPEPPPGNNRPWLLRAGRDRWAVGVFDMAVVDARPWPAGAEDPEKGDGTGTTGGAGPPARLLRLAVRAVYGAGLDFATVVIRPEGAGRAVVERIDPAPEPDERSWPAWRDALAGLAAEAARRRQGRTEAVLGMDPEFVLLNESGKIVPASRFFHRRGEVGFDNATVPGRSGVHPLVELRPAPSGEPETLIRSLRRTMWMAAARIGDPGLKWVAGGMPVPGLPLGGHIHISGVRLTGALVRALDNSLALPLALLEDETAAARRRRYGKPGDVRVKSHGGFEYRTLPSLLVSPRITKGALALAKLIAEHYERLPERPLDDPDLLAAFASGNKEALKAAALRQWERVTRLPAYRDHARFLDPLGEWIAAGKAWQRETDFRKPWRIPPFP